MMRVIQQELAHDRASQEFFLHGAGKKHETFGGYLRRTGVQTFTPDPTEKRGERTIQQVKQKLGRFYRPPIKA